jgi:hypothetical protein
MVVHDPRAGLRRCPHALGRLRVRDGRGGRRRHSARNGRSGRGAVAIQSDRAERRRRGGGGRWAHRRDGARGTRREVVRVDLDGRQSPRARVGLAGLGRVHRAHHLGFAPRHQPRAEQRREGGQCCGHHKRSRSSLHPRTIPALPRAGRRSRLDTSTPAGHARSRSTSTPRRRCVRTRCSKTSSTRPRATSPWPSAPSAPRWASPRRRFDPPSPPTSAPASTRPRRCGSPPSPT